MTADTPTEAILTERFFRAFVSIFRYLCESPIVRITVVIFWLILGNSIMTERIYPFPKNENCSQDEKTKETPPKENNSLLM